MLDVKSPFQVSGVAILYLCGCIGSDRLVSPPQAVEQPDMAYAAL